MVSVEEEIARMVSLPQKDKAGSEKQMLGMLSRAPGPAFFSSYNPYFPKWPNVDNRNKIV